MSDPSEALPELRASDADREQTVSCCDTAPRTVS